MTAAIADLDLVRRAVEHCRNDGAAPRVDLDRSVVERTHDRVRVVLVSPDDRLVMALEAIEAEGRLTFVPTSLRGVGRVLSSGRAAAISTIPRAR